MQSARPIFAALVALCIVVGSLALPTAIQVAVCRMTGRIMPVPASHTEHRSCCGNQFSVSTGTAIANPSCCCVKSAERDSILPATLLPHPIESYDAVLTEPTRLSYRREVIAVSFTHQDTDRIPPRAPPARLIAPRAPPANS